MIDLIENSKRHVPVGEVLMIRKLKCKNRGHYKFSPGLTFIGFMANMTLLTEMTRMTGMTGMIRMTRVTGMTGITKMTVDFYSD